MSIFSRLTQRFTSPPIADINHVYYGTAELIERFKAQHDLNNRFHYIAVPAEKGFDGRLDFATKDWITLSGVQSVTILGTDKADANKQLDQLKAAASFRYFVGFTEVIMSTREERKPTWEDAAKPARERSPLALAAARLFTHRTRDCAAEAAATLAHTAQVRVTI